MWSRGLRWLTATDATCMNELELSYRTLHAKVEAMPHGPMAYLVSPKWRRVCNVIGLLGMAAGLLPSLLILFWEPQHWMIWLARSGLAAIALGWIPVVLRDVWVVVRSIRSWRREQAEQLDHDYLEWARLSKWIATHPRVQLERHLRWLQMCNTRMTAKLNFLAGGIEKLGVLPVIVALAVQARVATDVADVPTWQLILGLFAGITYLVALVGSLMRLRMQLYEMAVTEALRLLDEAESS